MTGNDEHLKLIADIRKVLDEATLDADSRAALQRARGHALQNSRRKSWRMPWLQFALGTSLLAVLAVNLPERGMLSDGQGPTHQVAVIEPAPAKAANTTSKTEAVKSKTPAESVAAASAAMDADLLENLEMYEDAEFYQWLSEQDAEGASDV